MVGFENAAPAWPDKRNPTPPSVLSVSSVVKFLFAVDCPVFRLKGLSSDAISQTPYQSDFFSDRQNFFETPSTRTRTSSSEGGDEENEAGKAIPFFNLLVGSEGFRSDLDNGGKGTQGIIYGF